MKRRFIVGSVLIFSILLSMAMVPRLVTAKNQVVIDITGSVIKKVDGKYTGGWNPKKITVNEGDEVVLRIKSVDAEHVFALKGYDIEKDVFPGHPAEVRFTADKPGMFYFNCGMECGPYHKQMVGQFIVEKK